MNATKIVRISGTTPLIGLRASLIAILLLVSVVVPGSVASASSLLVHTRSGDVTGVSDGSVNEWRGIPYAAPPLGNLRWRPPAAAPTWSGVRDATHFAAPCIQLEFDANGPTGRTTGTEDCLKLNVFAPDSASPNSRLPVMVHLHPGRNALGRAYTDATALVDRGVIVVTLDYRLGVFGFVGHPALSAEGHGSSGEYGMLDQLAALRWVQQNIAKFGGDPANVTLFGSSAGSFDTVALVASPLAKGLFARASVQGEVSWALTGDGATISDYAEPAGVYTSDVVGCGTATDVLECLRAEPADALVKALGFFDVPPWVGGVVLPKAPLDSLLGHAAVPLLIGFDREEDRYFALPYPLPDPYTQSMWVQDSNALVGSEKGQQARDLYPPDAYGSRAWSYITMDTDTIRGCPTRRLADAVTTPVWRWLNTHTYENDPRLAEGRAFHISEEPFLWGDFQDFNHTPSTAEQTLSNRMIQYWTNFAKTGDPNGFGLPVWPRYNKVSEPIITLDDQIGVQTSYHVNECKLLDTVSLPAP